MKFLKVSASLIFFLVLLEALSLVWINFFVTPRPVGQNVWKTLRPASAQKAGMEDLFPNSLTSQTITDSSGEKKEIIYSINRLGLRGREPETVSPKKFHLLVSGDSFVFGQAVLENETITSYLSELHPDSNVWNLGQSGGGMNTALRLFDLVNPREFSKEDEGFLIYVFSSFHIGRWFRHPKLIRWATPWIPVYQEDQGKFLYQGKLGKNWKYRFFRTLEKSDFGKILSNSLMNFGGSINQEDIQGYFDAVLEYKRRYLEIYPKGRFVVVTHPLQSGDDKISLMAEEAKRREIEFYDSLSDWKATHPEKNSHYMIPEDGHPTAEVNSWFARWISERTIKR